MSTFDRISIRRMHEYLLMYDLGSIFYAILEVLFRGYTHFSMVITGGICVVGIHVINRKLNRRSLFFRAMISGIWITATEFFVGCLVNLYLGWHVWSYADQPFNLLGQICPLFSFVWFFISIPVLFISNLISDSNMS